MIPKNAVPGKVGADDCIKHVLVVDDIPEICRLFSAIHRRIRDPAVKLTVEVNSARALELVQTRPYDVIVSDYRMREVDGLTVLGAARQANPSGRRVLMTGHEEISTTMDRIAAARVDGYVQKPLHYQDLLAMLVDMIRGEPSALQTYRDEAREVERTGGSRARTGVARPSAANAEPDRSPSS